MKEKLRYYSQFGEDKILSEIFKEVKGVCVDVGANDGEYGSNTLFFEQQGWDCILIEPNPSLIKVLKERRRAKIYPYAATSKEGVATLYIAGGSSMAHGVSMISDNENDARKTIGSYGFNYVAEQVHATTLNVILSDANVSPGMEFISIDVEGHEVDALNGFDIGKWKPRILIIENNSIEDRSVDAFMNKNGYVRFKRTGVNDWYAAREDKQLLNIKNLVHLHFVDYGARVKRYIKRFPWIMRSVHLLKNLKMKKNSEQ
jgi:FkbM family methyltransferase